MTTYVKEPSAQLDYLTSWTPWLGAGETITDHEVSADAGITIVTTSASDEDVTTWLDGGTDGERYTVSVLVTTSAGRTDQREFTVAVRDDMATLQELKARLGKTLSVDDGELLDMLEAAEAEYTELIGPIGETTARFHGGQTSIILPAGVTAVTAAAYDDGTEIDLDDLDLDTRTGILHWGYNTAGVFTYGSRNVTLTYTVALPANHREAIIADVAGYFAATQRGGGSRGTAFPSEAAVDAYDAVGGPITLFPRIRALAERMPSIA